MTIPDAAPSNSKRKKFPRIAALVDSKAFAWTEGISLVVASIILSYQNYQLFKASGHDWGLLVFVVLTMWGYFSLLRTIQILYSRTSVAVGLFVLIYHIVVAFSASIICFAMGYVHLSHQDPHAFNQPLSLLMAVYFSITTFATVGFGDIVPTSNAARIAVSAEILLAMFFAVLIFSAFAGFVVSRTRR
jgi:hypothetical protein